MDDFGKIRVYRCPGCYAQPVRPIHDPRITGVPWPKPCDRCGGPLDGLPYVIEDAMRFAEHQTRRG